MCPYYCSIFITSCYTSPLSSYFFLNYLLPLFSLHDQICDILKGSLLVKETPVAVKVARLYLLSDILYNSAAPVKHASHYRYIWRSGKESPSPLLSSPHLSSPFLCAVLCCATLPFCFIFVLRFLLTSFYWSPHT